MVHCSFCLYRHSLVCVHRATRVRALCEQIMAAGRLLPEHNFARALRPLVPRLEKVAVKLQAIANLNRAVHLGTYKELVVRALGKEG